MAKLAGTRSSVFPAGGAFFPETPFRRALWLPLVLFILSSAQAQQDSLRKAVRELRDFEVHCRYTRLNVSHSLDDRALEKIVAMDGVSLIGKSQDMALSLRCDSAVVWLDPKSGVGLKKRGEKKIERPGRPFYGDMATGVRQFDFRSIRGIYAEGGVHLQLEDNILRADRLYFDTVGNRILIVHGFVSTLLSQGKFNEGGPPVPFLARARELRIHLKRQLKKGGSFSRSISRIRGKGTSVTSCDFGIPHYHIHARDLAVDPHDDEFMTVALEGATLNIQEFPVFYLPYLWGRTSILKYFPLRHLGPHPQSLK